MVRTAAETSGVSMSEMLQSSGVIFQRTSKFLLVLSALTLIFILAYQVPNPFRLPPHASGGLADFAVLNSNSASSSSLDPEEASLERILEAASTDDKTVILTTLNEAWATPGSILDLFLESFQIGNQTHQLLKHLVIIALDQKAYKRCLDVHPYCYALTTEGVDFSGGEAYFMTPDYLKMMWRRIDFLRSILEMGFNFIFTDADILWFRDPVLRFYPDADFQIACDHFTGRSDDINNRPNGGFNYVKSNNRTISFYKFWYSSRNTHPGRHDQDVLNMIKRDPFITNLGLKIRFLDTAYFGGLCEPSRDFNVVCTMHVNCCFGLDSKLQDLRIMLEDWRKFMSLPPALKRSGNLSWRVPHNCSLKSFRRVGSSKKKDVKQGRRLTTLRTV